MCPFQGKNLRTEMDVTYNKLRIIKDNIDSGPVTKPEKIRLY